MNALRMSVTICPYCNLVQGCIMSGSIIFQDVDCNQDCEDECSRFKGCVIIEHKELFDINEVICNECLIYYQEGSC
jgi:hypothetical protein